MRKDLAILIQKNDKCSKPKDIFDRWLCGHESCHESKIKHRVDYKGDESVVPWQRQRPSKRENYFAIQDCYVQKSES